MHRPWLLLAIIVLGIASVTASIASMSLAGSPSSATPASSTSKPVARYYDAVNRLIATGDSSRLRDILHPDMRDIDLATGEKRSWTAIEGRGRFLHEVAPGAMLEPVVSSGDSGAVQALVELRRPAVPSSLGLMLDASVPLWPHYESFEVAEGQIVERRSRSDGLVSVETLSRVPFSSEVASGTALDLRLDTYAAGSASSFPTGPAPAIVHVVTGQVIIELIVEALTPAIRLDPAPDGGRSAWQPQPPEGKQVLEAGSTLIVAPKALVRLRNPNADEAKVLVLVPRDPADASTSREKMPYIQGDASPSVLGVTSQPLAGREPAQLEHPAQVRVGSMELMPRARVPIDPESQLLIAVPEGGAPVGFIRQEGCLRSLAPRNAPTGALYCLTQPGGPVLLNAGDAPVRAWVAAVTLATERDSTHRA